MNPETTFWNSVTILLDLKINKNKVNNKLVKEKQLSNSASYEHYSGTGCVAKICPRKNPTSTNGFCFNETLVPSMPYSLA